MKKVLITPLDWGLGHATRSIPIIRELISRECSVSIGASGNSLALLKKEFPLLQFFELPGYNPVYPSSGSMVWKMASQLSKFRKVIRKEHEYVEHIIQENKIDLIISDNRYGCWSKKIPSVFISHQMNILMPKRFGWLAGVVQYLNFRMINRFTYCCIPDYPNGHCLAGELISFADHNIQSKLLYIGSLSRFKLSTPREKKFDVLCIFSGPEPQRSIFEKIVTDQLPASGLKYFIVRGIFSSVNEDYSSVCVPTDRNKKWSVTTQPIDRPAVEDKHAVNFLTTEKLQEVIEQSNSSICVPTDRNKTWSVRTQTTDGTSIEDTHAVNFLTTEKLQEVIEQSEVIIARSGFSTVMDLAALGKKAIFIPTPGQTEQEYLADTLMKKKIAFSMHQDKLNVLTAINESKNYMGFTTHQNEDDLLKKALDNILSS